ncbi:MAG: FAD-dependent oxidoreductase [Acidobacteriota bacterium]|nr:FAD-dependent oxidoreductase [Acidobacteriota bacterium]
MIAIIGAGPTGLGAAHRLHELGVTDYVVIERSDAAGGLASSYVDDHGFTWDVGGHVQFSHYRYYDEVLDRLVTCGWLEHERHASVWIRERWVPYPFQYNVHCLPPLDRDRALADIEALAGQTGLRRPANFRQWIDQSFGQMIAELFMIPYNFKVWGYPLETMDTEWMGERVATVDVARLRRNIAEGRDDVAWGPNNRFRFPLRGGTGAIWTHVAASLPADNMRWGCEITSLDAAGRVLRTQTGETITYDHLISTMPLDSLCALADGLPGDTRAAARSLVHSSVHVLGVGLRGDQPESLLHRCWMYFPESSSPYYRVTVFSNYSPHNVPDGDGYWSLMAEVCESPHRPVDRAALQRWTLDAMRRDGLIGEGSEVVSFWHFRREHGYPTPFLGRDQVLQRIRPHLEDRNICSRGRFGAWKYEVSNQDHSFMQGVEAIDRLLRLGEEPTLDRPNHVNSGAFNAFPSQRAAR